MSKSAQMPSVAWSLRLCLSNPMCKRLGRIRPMAAESSVAVARRATREGPRAHCCGTRWRASMAALPIAGRGLGVDAMELAWLLLGNIYCIFAHCGLVGNPHLTAKIQVFAPLPTSNQVMYIWVWVKLNHQGTTGFSPCFHLPGFHLGYLFLTHSHMQLGGYIDRQVDR